MNRDSQLDIVRGLAIISVIAFHTAHVSTLALVDSGYTFSWVDSFASYLAGFGKYGVQLFFFLSGVLLAKIYGRDSSLSLCAYIARRLGRILPLWWVFAISSFLLYYIFNMGWWKDLLGATDGGTSAQIQVAISTLFFLTWALIPGTPLRAIPGGWSIESEMVHYALFPLLRKFSNLKLIAAIAICGFLSAFNDFSISNIPAFQEISLRLEWLSIFTTLPFFLGGLLFVNWDKVILKKSLALKYVPFWALSGFGVLLLTQNASVSEGLCFGILAFGASYLLIKNRLISRMLSEIGKYSYFIYFFHFYPLSVFASLHTNIQSWAIFESISQIPFAFPVLSFIYFCLALGSSLLLGNLSYKYFENPILRRARLIK